MTVNEGGGHVELTAWLMKGGVDFRHSLPDAGLSSSVTHLPQ